jgi:hypothetical protein
MGALFGVYVTKAPLTEDVRILNIKSMKETLSGHTSSRNLMMHHSFQTVINYTPSAIMEELIHGNFS